MSICMCVCVCMCVYAGRLTSTASRQVVKFARATHTRSPTWPSGSSADAYHEILKAGGFMIAELIRRALSAT